jgi:hypothetical protein
MKHILAMLAIEALTLFLVVHPMELLLPFALIDLVFLTFVVSK